MENLSPHVMRILCKEMRNILENPLEGIEVNFDESNLSSVEAVIDGPKDTPYANGKFKVVLSLDKQFPSTPPKGYFQTKIFHPNVANNGEICVNTLKRDWKPDLGIQHILLTIKCLLIVPNPESALNEEAGKLLLEHYNDYFARAKLFTEIHASSATTSDESGLDPPSVETTKKMNVKQTSIKSQAVKDKKRTLKRL